MVHSHHIKYTAQANSDMTTLRLVQTSKYYNSKRHSKLLNIIKKSYLQKFSIFGKKMTFISMCMKYETDFIFLGYRVDDRL